MKYYLLLVCFAASTLLSSCMKMNCSDDSDSLEGNWKMISVKTNSNSQAVGKNASITGDVIVSFAPSGRSGGTFTGRTPSNSFGPDKYSSKEQSLTIAGLTMTKVMETTWGAHFVDNIREAKKYKVSNGTLNIITISKTLIFTRVQS